MKNQSRHLEVSATQAKDMDCGSRKREDKDKEATTDANRQGTVCANPSVTKKLEHLRNLDNS